MKKLYRDLVKDCDSQVNKCTPSKCEHFIDCKAIIRNGYPRPYQYLGVDSHAAILNTPVDTLVMRA